MIFLAAAARARRDCMKAKSEDHNGDTKTHSWNI